MIGRIRLCAALPHESSVISREVRVDVHANSAVAGSMSLGLFDRYVDWPSYHSDHSDHDCFWTS